MRNNLSLPLPLLLVLLYPFILINPVHELAHTSYRLPGQQLPQIMHDRYADLESPYSHIIKVPINLIKHLLISIRVCFQGHPVSHGHGQQRVQR